jgi:hypothetical protein
MSLSRIALRVFLVIALLTAIGWVSFADPYAYVNDRPKFHVGYLWMSVEGTILGTLVGGFACLIVCGAVAMARRLRKHEDTKAKQGTGGSPPGLG